MIIANRGHLLATICDIGLLYYNCLISMHVQGRMHRGYFNVFSLSLTYRQ